MRLVRLSVERFQCIEAATLELGPGLNVLYGPNDLGKSSLAWAIRAVLLLQHNSAAHTRFVSWYGGGEPKVVLTLQDDDDRYWRIAKTFGGGTGGRSTLESSKNGQTYSAEASGRQVDDRLRGLLRWGVHRPGGRGTPHGMPASFMTQVLLAEQDDVRKILFDSSLAKDEDESGRLRLGEALGALAQDPLFKKVLDEAQAQTDLAFTPTGKRKRGAGSPFVEIAKKLEELQQQRDALAEKLRETDLAEAKIVELNTRREAHELQAEDARVNLAELKTRLGVKQQRDALAAQIAQHHQRISSVASQQEQLSSKTTEHRRLDARLIELAAQIETSTAAVAAAETLAERLRRELDELSTGKTPADGTIDQLNEREKTAVETEHETKRAVENADSALRRATTIARGVRDAATAHTKAAELVRGADERCAAATSKEELARTALEAAKQRLRDATSGDKARARELSRQQLQNQSLQLAAQRSEIERTLERTTSIESLSTQLDSLRLETTQLSELTSKSREVAAQEQAAVDRIEQELSIARQLEKYGRLHEATAAVRLAEAAGKEADREQARAAALHSEAVALRAKVPPDLATAATIETLRRLHHHLEVAQARLGAVSVTLRPKRELTVQIAQDGLIVARRSVTEPVSVSGEREVSLAIEDIAEIEITGGDATTRADVARLKEQWHREGTAALQSAKVETLAQLVALRAEADRALAEADTRERDARAAEDLAARQRPSNLGQLEQARSEIEAELAGHDLVELRRRFESLGTSWSQALKRLVDDGQRQHRDQRTQLDQRLALVARAEAQLEAHGRDVANKARELDDQTASLTEPWTETAARCRNELARLDGERAGVDGALAELSGTGSGEESAARTAVESAEREVNDAQKERERGAIEAQRARDQLIAARTQLDAARSEAREHDACGAWTATLLDELPQLSTSSWQDALTTATEARERCQRDLVDVRAQVADVTRKRSAAIGTARTQATEAQQALASTRQHVDQLREQERADRGRATALQSEIAELRVQLAGADIDRARAAVAELQRQLEALPDAGRIESSDVERQTELAERLAKQLRDVEDELQKSRGALEHVGGAIVREQIRELDQALQQHRERQRGLELEYDAWQLLVETLRAAESGQTQHLGRHLAAPVSRRFQQLTGGRYGGLELSAQLEAEGLHVAGEIREISALSAGTQDQLATLLRLCIAEQLKSTIVLDDHLSQSDPERIAWFNDALRSAAPQLQIILVTCRPDEVLSAGERPAEGEAFRVSAAGLTRAIDLGRVIRRFAASVPVNSSPSLAGVRS